MRYYTKITCFENKRRLQFLHRFREQVSLYFDNLYKGKDAWMAGGPIEEEPAKKARIQINRMLEETHSMIAQAGVTTMIASSPPIDVVLNIFILYSYPQIENKSIFDVVDRSIGVYESNARSSFIRTINPFYWVGLILDYIVQFPFSLLGKVGFDRKKIEDSSIGRVVKFICYLVTVFAAVLTILHFMGYLDKFIKLVGVGN